MSVKCRARMGAGPKRRLSVKPCTNQTLNETYPFSFAQLNTHHPHSRSLNPLPRSPSASPSPSS